MSLAIDVQNVTRVFESKKKEPFYALRDANLQVQRGEMFGLLGPNGAGKSTLIKILSTLLLPTSGTARVAGFDVVREADRVRRSINMVSGGEHSGYGILTVRESLWLFSQFHGVPSREALRRIDEALEIVGLADSAHTRINKLSTGMRQKMNFVRGLFERPDGAVSRRTDLGARCGDGSGAAGLLETLDEGEAGPDDFADDALHGGSRRAVRPSGHHRRRSHFDLRHAGQPETHDAGRSGAEDGNQPGAAGVRGFCGG